MDWDPQTEGHRAVYRPEIKFQIKVAECIWENGSICRLLNIWTPPVEQSIGFCFEDSPSNGYTLIIRNTFIYPSWGAVSKFIWHVSWSDSLFFLYAYYKGTKRPINYFTFRRTRSIFPNWDAWSLAMIPPVYKSHCLVLSDNFTALFTSLVLASKLFFSSENGWNVRETEDVNPITTWESSDTTSMLIINKNLSRSVVMYQAKPALVYEAQLCNI